MSVTSSLPDTATGASKSPRAMSRMAAARATSRCSKWRPTNSQAMRKAPPMLIRFSTASKPIPVLAAAWDSALTLTASWFTWATSFSMSLSNPADASRPAAKAWRSCASRSRNSRRSGKMPSSASPISISRLPMLCSASLGVWVAMRCRERRKLWLALWKRSASGSIRSRSDRDSASPSREPPRFACWPMSIRSR